MPAGPLILLPSRRNNGVLVQSRIVMPDNIMPSITAPSELSRANPLLPSKTQLEMAIFLKPPLDSVPSLMLPLNSSGKYGTTLDCLTLSGDHRFHVPSSMVPNS